MQHRAPLLRQPGACTCSGSAEPLPHAFKSCSAQLWRQASRRPWHWHQKRRPCAEQLPVRLRTPAQPRRQPCTTAQLPRRPHAVAVRASRAPGPAAPLQTPLQAVRTASGGALGPAPGPSAPRGSALQAVEALHEGAARPAPPAPEPPLAADTAQSVDEGRAGQAVLEVLQSVSDAVLLPAGSGGSGSGARVPEYWQARCFRPALEFLSWSCLQLNPGLAVR